MITYKIQPPKQPQKAKCSQNKYSSEQMHTDQIQQTIPAQNKATPHYMVLKGITGFSNLHIRSMYHSKCDKIKHLKQSNKALSNQNQLNNFKNRNRLLSPGSAEHRSSFPPFIYSLLPPHRSQNIHIKKIRHHQPFFFAHSETANRTPIQHPRNHKIQHQISLSTHTIPKSIPQLTQQQQLTHTTKINTIKHDNHQIQSNPTQTSKNHNPIFSNNNN